MARRPQRLSATIAVALLLAAGVRADEKPAFRVIVNPANPVSSLERRYVADIFLKKVTRWPNNDLVKPVDQTSDGAVREHFSQDVLARSVIAVKSFWQQQIFSGRGVPPLELDNDASVVSYVLKHPGAIGYVSGGCDLGGAKVVAVK